MTFDESKVLDEKILRERGHRYKLQFGNESPSNDDKCCVCGKSFGKHYGSDCPKERKCR